MVVHESFADFLLFLYVHMSHADNQYEPAELQAIQSKMKTLYPAGTDLEKKLYAALRSYQHLDKSAIHTLIEDSVQFFSEQQDIPVEQITRDLQEIIHADGTVHQHELKVLEAFTRLMKTVSSAHSA